jgi:hypothetical protein
MDPQSGQDSNIEIKEGTSCMTACTAAFGGCPPQRGSYPKWRLPLLDRRGAEHIKRFREATIECEAGWWTKIDENRSRS